MSRPHVMLYTKQQLELVLKGWECTEPVPTTGKALSVGFPGRFIDLAVVEKTSLKSNYGDTLWRVTTSSRAGREFDATIQEAHVVAYRNERLEATRRANLARYQAMTAASL